MEETGKKSAEESESLYVGSSALSSGVSNLRTSSHSPRQEDDDDKEHEKNTVFPGCYVDIHLFLVNLFFFVCFKY